MGITVGMITIDSTDPAPLATFYSEALGLPIVQQFEEFFFILAGPAQPVAVAIQAVEEVTPGKNRVHIDFSSDDPEAEVQRLESLGATSLGKRGDDSFWWITLTDPQGNEFCIAHPHT